MIREEKLFNKVNFIGKGGDFSSDLTKRSFFIIHEGWLYIFEPNYDAFMYYMRTARLRKYRNIVFCISHIHDDAMNGINSFLSCIHDRGEKEANVYIITRVDDVIKTLVASGIYPRYTKNTHIVHELVNTASLDVVTVDMIHGEFDSCGFLVNDRKSTTNDNIFYTGDCSEIPAIIMRRFIEGSIKGLITDVTLEYPSTEHVSFKFFKDLVSVYGTDILNRIKFVHFQNEYEFTAINEAVERLIFNNIKRT